MISLAFFFLLNVTLGRLFAVTLSLAVAVGVLIALLHPLASVNSHSSRERRGGGGEGRGGEGRGNHVSCSHLAVLQDQVLSCLKATDDLKTCERGSARGTSDKVQKEKRRCLVVSTGVQRH